MLLVRCLIKQLMQLNLKMFALQGKRVFQKLGIVDR